MSSSGVIGGSFSEINNPYYLYDSESGEQFYHEDVIKRIKETFESKSKESIAVLQGNPGSGKTGTLKKIEKTPGLLGEKFVPVYLDVRNYVDLDVDDLSFSLYKDVVDNLNKRGYKIPQPEFFRVWRRKDNISSLDSIFLTVKSNLREEETLLVILDELDYFLDKTDSGIVSSFVGYIKNIDEKWSNYGLILAGDRRLPDLTTDETIKNLISTAVNIDVNEILKEENIKSFIVEPVKGKLDYDDDAVKSIMGYSGENLSFQQLICHQLVNHLNDKQRNICKVEDVEQVINRILDKPTEEFEYYWENKFSKEAQIIASALADERITEKRGNSYIFKGSTLLSNIFARDFSREMGKLKDFGYLNRIEKGQFTLFPFKVGLYGKWVQKEHPFLKTLLQNIDAIAEKVDLPTLIEELEKVPAEELIPFDKESILDISKKWYSLVENILKSRSIADRKHLEEFFKTFCHILDLNIKKESSSRENYFIIDIKNLRIGTLEEALCFIQDSSELSKSEISYIEKRAVRFAQESKNRLTFFFYFKKNDLVESLSNKPHLRLITINENDLKKIILSHRHLEAARHVVFGKLPLQLVSPYIIAGPTTIIFYGRSEIINRIIGNTDTSYAIVGARKIGKSSLQLKLQEDAPPGVTYIYKDLEYEFLNAKSYKPFLISLKSEIGRKFGKKVDFNKFPLGPDISRIPEVVRDLAQDGRKIIFAFDEIDDLIAFDRKNKFRLLHIFRALSQEKACQFVFAGFKELFWQEREDIDNPLYNFCEKIVLGPLEKEAALALITTPMESIGVRYKHKEDRELILGYTGCHPNLLQFFCKKLIENVDKHRKDARRIIFREDIGRIYDTEYEEYIMDEIYIFSKLNAIEKYILILLVEERLDGKTFSANKVSEKLLSEDIEIPIDEINQRLRDLEQRFILVDKGSGNYRFALDVFPEILKKRTDEFYKNEIRLEIKANER